MTYPSWEKEKDTRHITCSLCKLRRTVQYGRYRRIKDHSLYKCFKCTRPKKGLFKGSFKKGMTPWNKGTKGLQVSPFKGKKRPEFAGENSPHWKGDNVGYGALHEWIRKYLGKPDTCENCNKSGLSRMQINWANRSGDYKREASDWIRLCIKCHRAYDK